MKPHCKEFLKVFDEALNVSDSSIMGDAFQVLHPYQYSNLEYDDGSFSLYNEKDVDKKIVDFLETCDPDNPSEYIETEESRIEWWLSGKDYILGVEWSSDQIFSSWIIPIIELQRLSREIRVFIENDEESTND